jgi:hypothetical protein
MVSFFRSYERDFSANPAGVADHESEKNSGTPTEKVDARLDSDLAFDVNPDELTFEDCRSPRVALFSSLSWLTRC